MRVLIGAYLILPGMSFERKVLGDRVRKGRRAVMMEETMYFRAQRESKARILRQFHFSQQHSKDCKGSWVLVFLFLFYVHGTEVVLNLH